MVPLVCSRALELVVAHSGLWIKVQVSMSAEHEQVDLVDRIASILRRIGTFWLSRPYYQQVALVLAILLAKNAFDIELRNIQEAYLPGAQEFPTAVGYFSGSYGQVVIAAALGISTTTQWVILHVILIAIALTTAFWLVGRRDAPSRSFLILALAAATATSSLFVSIGKYDVITYLGAVILALSRSLPAATLGALIMASGNPAQSIVASLALLILTLAHEFRDLRRRAVAALVATTLTWLVVQLWFNVSGMSVSRVTLLPEYLAESLARVFAYPGAAIWSWLGAGWLLALTAVFACKVSSRIWLLLAVVAIPGAVTVITADGARVFGLVVLPAYLVVMIWLERCALREPKVRELALGMLLIGVAILPSAAQGPGWLFSQILVALGRI